MKIAEIIHSVVDPEMKEAPVTNFLQRVANAFTPGGKVKRPLDFKGLGTQPTTTPPAVTPVAASAVGTPMISSADAVPNAVGLVPTKRRPEI